ncbi:hypothetical protein AALB16_10790 [Lachnospiraceae bacterium 62-35]
MADNNDGKIVLTVDMPKTVRQINADIDKLQKQLKRLKLNGALDLSSQAKQINAQIAALQSQLKEIDLKVKVDTSDVQKAGQTLKQETDKGQSGVKTLSRSIAYLFMQAGTENIMESLFSGIKNAGRVTWYPFSRICLP